MLQKAFFKVDIVDRIYDTLVFEKTTPGAYEFTVPEEYNYVVIEIAGAAGQQQYVRASDGSTMWLGNIGRGSIKNITNKVINRNIFGILGAQPPKIFNQSQFGGSGYQSGQNGDVNTGTGSYVVAAGGGGGSSSVNFNNILTTVGGGSGVGGGATNLFNVKGGNGGGPNGGVAMLGTPIQEGSVYNGKDATDANIINYNSGNGYVKIWAGYNPYFKG